MIDGRDFRREALFWRDLLTRIAQDLERAAGAEKDPTREKWFAGRAMRIRKRLHEGMPDDWDPAPYQAHMNPTGPSDVDAKA